MEQYTLVSHLEAVLTDFASDLAGVIQHAVDGMAGRIA
jgi:hypothetical protein